MSNGGIQRINVDLVKNYFNNFEEEKDYYKNVTYNTFTSSYIKRCSDSRVSRMASRLLMQYKILDSSYNKIDKWWRQYNEAIESLEVSLSQDVRSFVKESSTNSYVQSKLPKLEEYKSTLEDEINTTLAEVSSPIFENNTVITDVDVVSDVEENVIGDIWSDVNQDINDSKIEDNVSEDVTTGDYILSSNTKVIEEETNGFIDKTLDFFKSVYLTGANVVSNGKARLSEAMIKVFYGSDELEASCFESVYAKLSNFNYPVDELMTYYEDGDLSFVYQLVKGKAQIKRIVLPNKDEINLTDKYITVKKSSGAEWTYKEDVIYVKNAEGMSLKLTKDGKLVEALNANQDTINIYDDFDQFGGDQMYFTYFNDQVVNDNKYLELLQEYFPGADIEDVEAFAYCLTRKGCGYTAAANEIYEYFEGREEEFLDSFGYSMYSVDSDGNLTPNYNYLIFEMAASRYQGQDIEEVYGEIMDIIDPETGLVRDGVELDEYNLPIFESIMKGAGITPYNTDIKKFCEEHGVNFSPSRADNYIPVSMDAYNYLITCGYHVVICVEDFALYDYDIETKTVGRCSHPKTSFHAMSVVGVADDGRYIVSSWGQVFVLDLTNATDFGGFIAVDISNENTGSVSSSDVTSEVSSIVNESLSSEFNEISPSSSTFSSDVSASIDIVSEASAEEVSTVTSIFAKIKDKASNTLDDAVDFFRSVYETGANIVSNSRLSEAMIKVFYGSDELEANYFESVCSKFQELNYSTDNLQSYYDADDIEFKYQYVNGQAQIKCLTLPNGDEISLSDKYVAIEKKNGIRYTYTEDYKYILNSDDKLLKLTNDGNLVRIYNNEIDNINIYDDFDQFGGDQMYFTYFNDQVVNDGKYLEILQEYFPGADIEDVEAFAYCITSHGCGYVAIANEIYEYFEGREDEFLKKFGYSMYSVDSEGNLSPNYNYLIFEMVASIYQGQDIEEVYGNIMDVVSEENGQIVDDALRNDDGSIIKDEIMKGAGPSVVSGPIKLFFENHGIDFNISLQNQWVEESVETYKMLMELNNYHLILIAENFDIYNYDPVTKEVGNLYYSGVGGHAMSIMGLTDDGRYIVSSWGKIMVCDLSNTERTGFCAIKIGDDNTAGVASNNTTSKVNSIVDGSSFASNVSASIDIVSEISAEEVSTVTSIFAKIKDKASNTLDDTIDLFKDVGAVVSTSAKGIYNGFSDWFNDASDWWNNTALPKIKEISSNIGNVLVRCACTIDAGVFSLVEGILRVGEALVDAYAIFMTIQLMPFTVIRDLRNKLIGLIIGKDIPSITKGMWSKTKAFVSVNAVSTVFDKFYENTKYGSFIKENAYGFEKTRAIGSGFGYVTGIAITAFATGGLSVIAELGFSSSAITAIVAGIAGFGKNAERSWADGASTTEGLAVATAGGLWEAFQFWIGGKIGELALFKTGGALGNIIGDKGISILNLLSRVTLDSVDGGAEAFALPAIDAIYKDGYYDDNGNYVEFKDDDNFIKRFWEMFDDNGGLSTFEIQAATGALASLGGEVFNGLFKKKTNVDLDTGNNLDNVLTVKTFEEQINEVNYHIQKGDILSFTFELDSFDDITPELLSRIDDASIVNFKVGDEVFDYIDVKEKTGLISNVDTKTLTKSFEEQISEVNYHIQKGDILSYTFELDSFDDITPELLSKIDDPSIVNFKVGDEVFDYIDVKKKTGLINNVDTKTLTKSFEEQISEANYHIQKGDILSYTFELDSLDDVTPDVLSKIDDASIVNFKVGDEVFDYYEIRKKLDFASPTVVTNITSYNKLPDNLKEYLSGLLTSEKGDYSVVKRLSDLLANAYENGDESTKTIVENFPFLSDVLDIKYLESLDGGTSSFVSFDKILGNKSAQFMNEIGFGKDFVYAHEIGHGLLEMIDNVTLPSNYDTVMDNLLKKWKENPIDLEDFLNTARDRQEDIWSRIRISTNEWMDANAKDIDDLIKKVIDDPKLLEEELRNSANRNMVSSSKIDEVVQGLLNNNNLNEIKEYIRRSFGTEHMWSNFTYECDADSTMGIYRIVLGLIDSAFNGDNPYYSTIYDNGFLRSHTQDYFSTDIAKSFNEQFADFTSMKLGNSKEAYQIVERLFGDEWLDMMENKYSNIAEKMKNHITDYDYDVGKNSIDSLFDLDDLNLYNESIFQRIKRFFSGDDYSYKVDGIDDITEQLNNNVTEKLDTVNQQSLNNIDETVSNNESLLDKIKSIFKKQNEHQYIEVSTKQEVLNKVCDPIDDYANLDTTVTWFFQNDGFNSSNPYEIYVSAVGQGSKKQIPSFSSINEFYKRFNFDNGYYVQSQGNYFTHVFSDQTIYDSVGSITDRLYINANYDDAFMFAQLFADKCEKKGIPFYFKTANFSDINNVPDLSLLRDESIVIYAAEDHLADYVNICNEIKQQNPNLEFYQPPVFTGTIDGFIGYGGESRDHSISYNKKRSNVMTNAIKNATEDYKSVYPYFDLNTIKSNPTDYYNYLHRIFEYAKIYSQYVGIDINNFSFSVD